MDEIVVHHQLSDGHEFEQILGDSEGQGSLHAAVPGLSNWQFGEALWKTLWRSLKKSELELLYDTENYTPGYLSEDDENTN